MKTFVAFNYKTQDGSGFDNMVLETKGIPNSKEDLEAIEEEVKKHYQHYKGSVGVEKVVILNYKSMEPHINLLIQNT